MSYIGPVKRLFHQINIAVGYNIPGYEKGAEHDHGIETPEVDVFEQGAWWKNKAVKVGLIDAGAENCDCGRCSSCGSALYEIQSLALDGPSLPDKTDDVQSIPMPKSKEIEEDDGDTTREKLAKAGDELTEEELNLKEEIELSRLRSIDATVRAHERAHMAVAGGLVRGGVSYQYRVGPDGKRYAVGGDVSIDTSSSSTPEATIRKMEAVRAAALAPAVPSGQDRRVAAQAAMVIMQARIELMSQKKAEEIQSEEGNTSSVTDIRNVAEPA